MGGLSLPLQPFSPLGMMVEHSLDSPGPSVPVIPCTSPPASSAEPASQGVVASASPVAYPCVCTSMSSGWAPWRECTSQCVHAPGGGCMSSVQVSPCGPWRALCTGVGHTCVHLLWPIGLSIWGLNFFVGWNQGGSHVCLPLPFCVFFVFGPRELRWSHSLAHGK